MAGINSSQTQRLELRFRRIFAQRGFHFYLPRVRFFWNLFWPRAPLFAMRKNFRKPLQTLPGKRLEFPAILAVKESLKGKSFTE
jgi:hypothetical protein